MKDTRRFFARIFDDEAAAKKCWETMRERFNTLPHEGVGLTRMIWGERHVVILLWEEDLLEGGSPWEVPDDVARAILLRRARMGLESMQKGSTSFEDRRRKYITQDGEEVSADH